MKKYNGYIAFLIAAVMLLSSVNVMAEQELLQADINYTNGEIEIVYTNPLAYDTYVTIYVTPASDAAILEDFSKTERISQAFCKSNDSVAFTVKCDDEMDGLYDIYAIPGGVDAMSGYAKLSRPVSVMGNSAANDILKEINNAYAENIGNVICRRLSDVLLLDEACPEWKHSFLYAIKTDDYSGGFSTIDQVRAAWSLAEVLHDICTVQDASKISEFIENNSFIKFDSDNADYVQYKDYFMSVYTQQLYDGKIKSKSAALSAFEETAALTAINKRDIKGKADAIMTYLSVYNLEDLKSDIEDVTPAAIARLLDGEEFSSVSDVKAVTADKIKLLDDSKSGGGGSSSTSSRGGSSGGSIALPNTGAVTAADPTYSFADVPFEHWANKAVEYLASIEVVNGFPDGMFKANTTVTREEFVKMAVAAFKLTGTDVNNAAFADVDEAFWAAPYIKTAVASGVIKGISEYEFGVSQPVIRQDAAVIIARCLLLAESDTEVKAFIDEELIDGYAIDSVRTMAGAGIINGYTDGSFRPYSMLTRAEAAQIIYNALIADN